MAAEYSADGVPVGIAYCPECNAVLSLELWILEAKDVALLHVCKQHGLAAISRPLE